MTIDSDSDDEHPPPTKKKKTNAYDARVQRINDLASELSEKHGS